MCQKRQISLPVGYKTATPKTGDWERLWRQFRTPSLAKTDFSVIFLLWANQFAKKWYSSALFMKKIIKRRRNLFFFARLGVLNWRHNRSKSPVFGLAVLYRTGSEIWCFWYIKTPERKIAMGKKKFFLLYLSAHWGDLIEQIKKRLSYTL